MTGLELIPLLTGVAIDRAVPNSSEAKRRLKRFESSKEISEQLGPIAAEFHDVLRKKLEKRAEGIDSVTLYSLAVNWEVIADGIDVSGIICESEKQAVETLVDEITGHEDVDLDDESIQELRDVLADAFTEVMATFCKRVSNDDELANTMQTTLKIDILQEIQSMREEFERLTQREPYDVYEFPDERGEIINALLPGNTVEFVDRAEVTEEPSPDRHFVLGPSGCGKTRIIAEYINRFPDDALSHVLFPQERLLTPDDARTLARRSFDGDLLLVWEDVHRIDENQENAVLDPAIRELYQSLNEQGHNLYTLLEAQTGQLHKIPGNLPRDFENNNSLWQEFEPLWVGELETTQIEHIADSMATKYGVNLPEDARDKLVARTVDVKSAPNYIDTVLKNVSDRQLSDDDIEQLPETVADIWENQYDDMQKTAPEEWKVLAAMKLLHDIRAPQSSTLIRAVYRRILDGDRGWFRAAVERLSDDKKWLTVKGDNLFDRETMYRVHDTQLDPIRVEGRDEAIALSTLLTEDSKHLVPSQFRERVHFLAGLTFYVWDYDQEAEAQWTTVLDIDPQHAIAHNNYANLLRNEFESYQQAVYHFERAIDIDPELAAAHHNYALLLRNELDDNQQAAHHFERAIDIDPQLAHSHHKYALLLTNELDDHQQAAHHLERAIDIDPEFVPAHHSYARLLETELDKQQQAAHHYERAIDIDPELAKAHFNYALLLAEELGDHKQAVNNLQRAIDIDPQFAQAHNKYAFLLTRNLGDHQQAAHHYERAIDIDPQYAEAHNDYALLLQIELGDYQQAAHHFERAIDIDSQLTQAHHSYANLLKNELGDNQQAAHHYERAIDIDPQLAQAHHNYATLLTNELGDNQQAAHHFERAIDIDPQLAQAHYNYAFLLTENLNNHQQAAHHFKRAIDIDPQNAQVHYTYAMILKNELEDHQQAAQHFERALHIDPEFAQAHHNYARLLIEKLDDYQQAVHHLERTIDIDPEFAQAHHNYATLLKNELDDHQQAAHHFERAIDIDPEFVLAHYSYALLLINKLGNHQEAAHHFERAIDIDPQSAQAHYNYATILTNELGDNQQAAHHFERALHIDPEFAQAHHNYATLLKNELDDHQQAAHHFERAIHIDPEFAQAHYIYAKLLKNELDDHQQAAHHFERTINIDPQHAQAHYNYGKLLWQSLDRPENAHDHLETSVRIWAAQEIVNVGSILNGLEMLVQICLELDDDHRTVEHCEVTNDLLNKSDKDRFKDYAWFNGQRVLASEDSPVQQLYYFAMMNITTDNLLVAIKLLDAVWCQRYDYKEDTTVRQYTRAAGIALIAHAEVINQTIMAENTSDLPSTDEVLGQLNPDDLYDPENILYARLAGDDPGVGAEHLRKHAEELYKKGDNTALEFEAFAALLEMVELNQTPLQDLLTWTVEPWAHLHENKARITEVYDSALFAAVKDDFDDAMKAFTTAWERRDEATAEEKRDAVAAGVALLAYIEMDIIEPDTIDQDALREVVEAERTMLSEAVLALYEACNGKEPRAYFAKLVAKFDDERETLDRDDLERLAVAELLGVLEFDVADV